MHTPALSFIRNGPQTLPVIPKAQNILATARTRIKTCLSLEHHQSHQFLLPTRTIDMQQFN